MNTREIAAEYRMSQWAQALQERAAKGETLGEFCRRIGVSQNAYFYWQRKLRAAAVNQIVREPTEASEALVPSGWAQVGAVSESHEAETGTLSVEIGKCRVMVSENTKPEMLAKVCKVLVSL
jgi:hypothetical protein